MEDSVSRLLVVSAQVAVLKVLGVEEKEVLVVREETIMKIQKTAVDLGEEEEVVEVVEE